MYITADKYYQSHPEFFPEINGKRVDFNHAKRRPQLCFTNQEMIECFKKEFEYHVQRVPGCTIYGIFAEDNYELCQCAKCREDIKLADGRVLKYGDPDFQSTRFFQFLTPIAKFAKKRFPNILISTYAYFFTEIPPAIDVPDNVIILTCPIYKNVKFPMTAPQNAETFNKLNGWLKKTDKIILYDYFGLTRKFPRPVDVSAAADYKEMVELYGAPFYPLMGMGEDTTFCFRAGQAGFKMYCDSRIKIGHIGEKIFDEQNYFRKVTHNAKTERLRELLRNTGEDETICLNYYQ